VIGPVRPHQSLSLEGPVQFSAGAATQSGLHVRIRITTDGTLILPDRGFAFDRTGGESGSSGRLRCTMSEICVLCPHIGAVDVFLGSLKTQPDSVIAGTIFLA